MRLLSTGRLGQRRVPFFEQPSYIIAQGEQMVDSPVQLVEALLHHVPDAAARRTARVAHTQNSLQI
jgi:hypothetical protein